MTSQDHSQSERFENINPHPTLGDERSLTRWQKFRMVVKVVELRLRFIALMALTGLVFGYWDTIWNYYEKWNRPVAEHAAVTAGVEFYCPMHPSVVQDEPGNCPICGMPLSKRPKGEKLTLPAGVTARIQLAPFRIAQAGIRTAEVGYSPMSESVTTVGYVTFDERRLARISSKIKGMARVEKLLVNFTGTFVEVGDPLAELYSPELYQATRELLLAQSTSAERSNAQTPLGQSLLGNKSDLVALARDKLALWGITPEQVDEILAKGKAEYRTPILAPLCGFVVRKNIVAGQYVTEGEAMFEVADLSHVWVQAQVYEDQFASIRQGQAVEATVNAYPGEVFRGKVAFIDPVLNPATRTVNVRYDMDNVDLKLRPGMYATVSLRTPVAETPLFQARTPTAKFPGRSIRTASLTVEDQKICPVTKAKLGSMGDPIPVEVEQRKIWVCCAGCPPKLKAEPERYFAVLSPPAIGVLSVPETAVIDSGDRKVVYVEAQPGVFEGRQVVLGPRIGDRYPVLDGLAPGDKVAAAGAFLIDAESRLNPTAVRAPAKSPDANPTSPVQNRSAAAPTGTPHRH
jgi:membrane fusion protein, copper/silver efflux system